MTADTWDDGSAYEPYVGRWSRLVAGEFIRWLQIPRSAWLDFGCGTGALTQTILRDADPRAVVGCDRSPGFVDYARKHTRDPRAQFVVATLPDLPSTPGGFDVAVSGLVLNFLPDPAEGVVSLMGRTRSGGIVSAYVWDYADGMEMMRYFWDAALALDPAAQGLDEGVRFPLCRPDHLTRLFEHAGLRDVTVHAIEIPTVFTSFEDYWTPFLGGQGPAPGYARSLPADRCDELRDRIGRQLPVSPDGRIRLTARAWAAKGIVPSSPTVRL